MTASSESVDERAEQVLYAVDADGIAVLTRTVPSAATRGRHFLPYPRPQA